MKKIILVLLLFFIAVSLFALSDDNFDVQNLISGIQRAGPPIVKNGYVIFTANKLHRHVGIAFDYENFRTIHSYERLVFYDMDNKPIDSILFFISKLPENKDSLAYRLVIDGLWTIDPLNPTMFFDATTNLNFSLIAIEEKTIQVTKETKSGSVRFVYEGKPGQNIRLAGSFSGWDPYIYQLEETSTGFYELELYLSPGTYYYTYYKGLTPFIDEKNPHRAYTKEGRIASVLYLN